MQDDTITSSTGRQQSATHRFYEVGRELLAKPNLLGELVEIEGVNPIIVYCNSPSDADFVEVMLKKRGITAQKLIGNVPPPRLERALEQIKSGELQVVVVTDIAARSIDLTLFDIAINYSVAPDADTYHLRAGRDQEGVKIRKILTIVSPLELANFLSLKKNNSLDIEKEELPSPEALEKARISNLAGRAANDAALQDEKVAKLVSLVMADPKRDKILALLVHNTFTVIPSLRAAAGKAEAEQEDSGDDFDSDNDDDYNRGNRGGDRGGYRGNDRRGGGGRGGRDRGGDRGGYRGNDRRGGGRGGRDMGGEQQQRYEGLPADAYEDVDGGNDQGDSRQFGHREGGRGGRDRGDRGDRRERGPRGGGAPAKKDARVYLGIGSGQNLSRDSLIELLESKCELSKDEIKHVSIRSNCAFFDLPDEQVKNVMDKLDGIGALGGAPLKPCKAITINSVNPQSQQNGEENAFEGGDSSLQEMQGDDSNGGGEEEYTA